MHMVYKAKLSPGYKVSCIHWAIIDKHCNLTGGMVALLLSKKIEDSNAELHIILVCSLYFLLYCMKLFMI